VGVPPLAAAPEGEALPEAEAQLLGARDALCVREGAALRVEKALRENVSETRSVGAPEPEGPNAGVPVARGALGEALGVGAGAVREGVPPPGVGVAPSREAVGAGVALRGAARVPVALREGSGERESACEALDSAEAGGEREADGVEEVEAEGAGEPLRLGGVEGVAEPAVGFGEGLGGAVGDGGAEGVPGRRDAVGRDEREEDALGGGEREARGEGDSEALAKEEMLPLGVRLSRRDVGADAEAVAARVGAGSPEALGVGVPGAEGVSGAGVGVLLPRGEALSVGTPAEGLGAPDAPPVAVPLPKRAPLRVGAARLGDALGVVEGERVARGDAEGELEGRGEGEGRGDADGEALADGEAPPLALRGGDAEAEAHALLDRDAAAEALPDTEALTTALSDATEEALSLPLARALSVPPERVALPLGVRVPHAEGVAAYDLAAVRVPARLAVAGAVGTSEGVARNGVLLRVAVPPRGDVEVRGEGEGEGGGERLASAEGETDALREGAADAVAREEGERREEKVRVEVKAGEALGV
jgi:hypothetical protein